MQTIPFSVCSHVPIISVYTFWGLCLFYFHFLAPKHSSTEEIPFVFQDLPDTVFKLEIYFEAVLLGIIVTGMPPYFAMENAENRRVNSV